MKKALKYILLVCVAVVAYAQEKKDITLEDIWKKGTFRQKSVYNVNWMNDGNFYTSLVGGESQSFVVKYDINKGVAVDTLIKSSNLKVKGAETPISIDSYTFSEDESKMLFTTNTESIYRRSYKADYYVYDVKTKNLVKLTSDGGESYATFSPDLSKVAFVRGNNLFYVNLTDMKLTQITKDGSWGKIINGSTDWVYEEEFSIAQAFFWSPDGKKIAYMVFDESNVKEYNMQTWGGLYPEDYKFKYPKAGEENAKVWVQIFDLTANKNIKADIGDENDIYVPRIKWTTDANKLSVYKMNRLQNKLELFLTDATSGKSNIILTETSETYIDINDDLTFLKNGKQFIYSSEKDGFKHIYLYDITGKLIRQVTKGNWEVLDFYGLDEKTQTVYFSSTENSPLEKQFYSIHLLKDKTKKQLSTAKGNHEIDLSKDFRYYLDFYSTANTPLLVTLNEANSGKQLKVMEDNKVLNEKLAGYKFSKKEFMKVPVNGVELNAWMIKPSNFDATKKYPVLMFVYGGPGSQTVEDKWDSGNMFWYQHLAQKGYIIVSVDNRGTGARGAAFKKCTYADLGKLETEDQIASAKFLATQNYVDANRIGIWGWSYGGYMTSLCLTLGADVFKTGIAVAPVTNWRFYDTIYTERYLKRPQENKDGYDNNSPNTQADKLKGNYFIIHGTGDDNVHFQNAVEMHEAMVKANKQFTSFYYPNRNHGIYGGNTRLHLYQMMTDYLIKNL
jgi:dipeptidyl-peptidase 4